jgi:hypothetical protein
MIGPGQFHGAKFYAGLRGADVSSRYLDAVSGWFGDPSVAVEVERELCAIRNSDRAPTWTGWRAVERIAAAYGIANLNLVKPGVGETTRVLLRRVPWRVLVRTGVEQDVAHVLLLADERGVPVEWVDDLAYSCVGLIRPEPT